jgi:hypothetical protein
LRFTAAVALAAAVVFTAAAVLAAAVVFTVADVLNTVADVLNTIAVVLNAVVRFPKNTLVLTKNQNLLNFYGLLTSNDQCAQSHFPFSKIWVNT